MNHKVETVFSLTKHSDFVLSQSVELQLSTLEHHLCLHGWDRKVHKYPLGKKFLAYLSVSTVEEMKYHLFSITSLKAHLFCGTHITCAHIHTEWLPIQNTVCHEKVIDFLLFFFLRMYCGKFTNCFEQYLFLIVLNVFYLMNHFLSCITTSCLQIQYYISSF